MRHTARGFGIYSEFTDTYQNRIRVQHSSAAMMDAVWIFCDGESDGKMVVGSAKPFRSAPHLSVSQAKRLIRALQKFIEVAEAGK